MHWILQTNLFQEREWENLVETLERFKLPYSVHKVIPFIGELVPPAEPKSSKVVCFGSYSLRHAARANNWNPGVYDLFDQNFTVQFAHWQDLMLNFDSEIRAFKDTHLTEPCFIRPIDDSKYFAGKVFEPSEWNEWVKNICVEGHDYGISLTPDTLVQVCKPKEIYSEYRYWIVDQRIVTRSLYKRGGKVIYSDQVDQRVDAFVTYVLKTDRVKSLLDAVTLEAGNNGWRPHRAFVLDVAETPSGFKVVEINTINSAGFYAGNVVEIIMALEDLER